MFSRGLLRGQGGANRALSGKRSKYVLCLYVYLRVGFTITDRLRLFIYTTHIKATPEYLVSGSWYVHHTTCLVRIYSGVYYMSRPDEQMLILMLMLIPVLVRSEVRMIPGTLVVQIIHTRFEYECIRVLNCYRCVPFGV